MTPPGLRMKEQVLHGADSSPSVVCSSPSKQDHWSSVHSQGATFHSGKADPPKATERPLRNTAQPHGVHLSSYKTVRSSPNPKRKKKSAWHSAEALLPESLLCASALKKWCQFFVHYKSLGDHLLRKEWWASKGRQRLGKGGTSPSRCGARRELGTSA